MQRRLDNTLHLKNLSTQIASTLRQNTIIGRHGDCDLILHGERGASRKHARITVQENDIYITDLGSLNGTLVNGREIQGTVKLKHGDLIIFDEQNYRINIPAINNLITATVPEIRRSEDNITIIANQAEAANPSRIRPAIRVVDQPELDENNDLNETWLEVDAIKMMRKSPSSELTDESQAAAKPETPQKNETAQPASQPSSPQSKPIEGGARIHQFNPRRRVDATPSRESETASASASVKATSAPAMETTSDKPEKQSTEDDFNGDATIAQANSKFESEIDALNLDLKHQQEAAVHHKTELELPPSEKEGQADSAFSTKTAYLQPPLLNDAAPASINSANMLSHKQEDKQQEEELEEALEFEFTNESRSPARKLRQSPSASIAYKRLRQVTDVDDLELAPTAAASSAQNRYSEAHETPQPKKADNNQEYLLDEDDLFDIPLDSPLPPQPNGRFRDIHASAQAGLQAERANIRQATRRRSKLKQWLVVLPLTLISIAILIFALYLAYNAGLKAQQQASQTSNNTL